MRSRVRWSPVASAASTPPGIHPAAPQAPPAGPGTGGDLQRQKPGCAAPRQPAGHRAFPQQRPARAGHAPHTGRDPRLKCRRRLRRDRNGASGPSTCLRDRRWRAAQGRGPGPSRQPRVRPRRDRRDRATSCRAAHRPAAAMTQTTCGRAGNHRRAAPAMRGHSVAAPDP